MENDDSIRASVNTGCISRNTVLKTREVTITLARPPLEMRALFGPHPGEDSGILAYIWGRLTSMVKDTETQHLGISRERE